MRAEKDDMRAEKDDMTAEQYDMRAERNTAPETTGPKPAEGCEQGAVPVGLAGTASSSVSILLSSSPLPWADLTFICCANNAVSNAMELSTANAAFLTIGW